MTPRRKYSRAKPAGTTRLLCLWLAVGGCEAAAEKTGLVLLVRSDLRTPGEISLIDLTITHAGKTEVRNLALGPGRLRLPFQLGVAVPGEGEAPILVHARGQLMGRDGSPREIVSRIVNIDPLRDEQRLVVVDLNRSCMKAHCPQGTTCIPGKGCVSPRIDLDGQLPDRAGPPCDCRHFFPMCVGARWRYRVRPAVGDPYIKTWMISDYGQIVDRSADTTLDIAYGKQSVEAFLQIRDSGTDRSRRWVARQGSEVQWQKSEWLDGNFERNVLRYDAPSRLRLDEARTTIGERWSLEYKQIEIGPPFHKPKEVVVPDHWEVIDPASVTDLAAEFRSKDLLCQRRVEMTTTPVTATYCFARGLGKVYEHTVSVEEEVLLEANVFCRTYP